MKLPEKEEKGDLFVASANDIGKSHFHNSVLFHWCDVWSLLLALSFNPKSRFTGSILSENRIQEFLIRLDLETAWWVKILSLCGVV